MTQKLYRSAKDKIIAGVCGGLAEYFEIDSTIIRLIFILILLLGGSAILLYLILWLLMSKGPKGPSEPAIITKEKVEEVAKEIKEKVQEFKPEVKKEQKTQEPTKEVTKRRGGLFGWILVILGILFLANNLFPWWVRFSASRYWPLALIVVGLILIFRAATNKR